MAYDIQNYTVTVGANQSVTVPRVTLSGTINNSTTGAQLFDFTGANAIVFPAILGTLTAQQRLDVLNLIANYLIATKLGL